MVYSTKMTHTSTDKKDKLYVLIKKGGSAGGGAAGSSTTLQLNTLCNRNR